MTDNGNKLKITILGVRGSIPTAGADMSIYGGETSAVLFETDEDAVFLDAGTGIVNAPDVGDKKISILLSHPHIDHLMGLAFFPYLNQPDRQIDIYARVIDGRGTRQQVDAFMSEPLWPCTIDDFKAKVVCHDLAGSTQIGGGKTAGGSAAKVATKQCDDKIRIDMIDSVHPGGGTVYKLTYANKSMVYATDYEHDDRQLPELIDFARDCDLLLYDAQYTNEEYEARRGFGHSTADVGMRVMSECRAQNMRFVHHDPGHDDKMLKAMEQEYKSDTVSFARAGEVIVL